MSWPIVPLASAFEFIRNGMSVKQDSGAGGLPITRIETISDGTVNPRKVGFAELGYPEATRWMLEKGDILFSHINSFEHVGKCAVYRGEPAELVHGMNLLCFRADKAKLDPEYAKHLLRSRRFRAHLERFINKAVNQASVSIGNLSNIPVTLPPLDEQHRIAAILDQAEALRAKRRAAIALLDQLPQAIFLEMFGDPIANPYAWPKSKLKELGRVTTGRTPPGSEAGMYGGTIPFITPGDLGSGECAKRTLSDVGARSVSLVRKGAAMVCCIGATIGKMDIAMKESAFNQQINAVDWHEVVSDLYGIECLRFYRIQIARDGASTTLPILKKSLFEEICIPVPPNEHQRRFSTRIEAIHRARASQQSALVELDALFSTLQNLSFGVGNAG